MWLRNPDRKRRFHDPELDARHVVDRWTRSGDYGSVGEDGRGGQRGAHGRFWGPRAPT